MENCTNNSESGKNAEKCYFGRPVKHVYKRRRENKELRSSVKLLALAKHFSSFLQN